MSCSKVYLTYKRKLPSTRKGITHDNGCHGSVSEGPSDTRVTALDDHHAESDPFVSENQQRNALIFPGCITCGVRGNLLQCEDCNQSYHHQCLDKSHKSKHILDREKLSCGCKLLDASALGPTGKSSELEAMKCSEESDEKPMTVDSCKSPVIESPVEGTPGKDTGSAPYLELSFEKRLHHAQEELVCQLTGIRTAKSFDFISSKSSVERSCITALNADSCLLKAPSLEETDSVPKDKSMDSPDNCYGEIKLITPLITFSRRCKRRKDNKETDVQSSFIEEKNLSPFNKLNITADDAVPLKVSMEDDSNNVLLAGDNADSRHMFCENQDNVKDVDSAHLHVQSAVKIEILMCDEDLSHGSESTSKNGLPIVEEGQISTIAIESEKNPLDNSSQISLNDAAKDPCEAMVVDTELKNTKHPDDTEIRSSCGVKAARVPHCTKESRQPCLDLSATPDSCNTLDDNVNLDMPCQKEHVHTTSGSLRGSMDSTSRSYAHVLDQESPPELVGVNERAEESLPFCSTRAHSDASTSVEEAGSNNSKENVEALPGSSVDNASENKCLQLFSEEIQSGLHQATTKPEVATSMVLEESKSLNSGSSNNQTGQTSWGSLLDLGLSVPTESNMGNYSEKSSLKSPMQNIDCRIRDFFQDAMHQSSSNQAASLLRHKLMLDSIVNRASALNVRGSFQDKSYTTFWSEEELDSLWIGIRRHGRDNWHAMLRDPRLHFSSWRTARDLAEQWEEEQVKLLNSHCPQYKSPSTHDISLDHNGSSFLYPKVGIWREKAIEETRLSLGDVYACRTGSFSKKRRFEYASVVNDAEHLHRPTTYRRNAPYSDFHSGIYAKGSYDHLAYMNVRCDPLLINIPFASSASGRGNLPHWLKEVVNTPPPRPMEATLPHSLSSIGQSGTMRITKPHPDPSELCFSGVGFCGIRASDLQPLGSALCSNATLGTRHGITEASRASTVLVNKPDNVIIIDSDASSEETISDDHSTRL